MRPSGWNLYFGYPVSPRANQSPSDEMCGAGRDSRHRVAKGQKTEENLRCEMRAAGKALNSHHEVFRASYMDLSFIANMQAAECSPGSKAVNGCVSAHPQ